MLSREKILDAGLELVDEEGPQGLTMRRLAQRLDVTATAIYHYFHGRDALLEAIVDHLSTRIVAEAPGEGDWTDQLRGLLTTMVEHALSHPSAVAWAITAYSKRPPTVRIHEAVLAILHDAGFSPEDAIYIKGAVMRFTVGHLTLNEAADGHEWRSLPDELFPHYRAAGPALDRSEPARQFTYGLNALLAGLSLKDAATPVDERPSLFT